MTPRSANLPAHFGHASDAPSEIDDEGGSLVNSTTPRRSRGQDGPKFLELEPVDKKEDRDLALSPVKRIAVVALAFGTSILLVNSVKFIFVRYRFKFPFFIAVGHMIFCWSGTALVLKSKGDVQLMSLQDRVRKVLPFTSFNALSMSCANVALTHIYPSYHEVIQSVSPLMTLLLSMIIDGKRYNYWAYAAMIPICGGAAFTSMEELNFSLVGTVLSLGAVVFRGLKVLLQGRLLCDEKVDSVTLCYYMAPFNLAIFSCAMLIFEGLDPVVEVFSMASPDLLLAMFFSSLLALGFNVASFLTVKYLNPLGAVVVANIKTPATVVVSVLIFGNAVSLGQVFGFLVTFFGVWLHGHKGQVLN